MTPRRMAKNRGLESNLYPDDRGGWKYIHPIKKADGTTKVTRWKPGTSKAAANAAARTLNEMYGKRHGVDGLIGQALDEPTYDEIGELAKRYVSEYLPTLKYTDAHRKTTEARVNKFASHFKGRDIKSISVLNASDYIDAMTPRTGIATRSALIKFYTWAIGKGRAKENVFESALCPIYEPVRGRIETIDQFNAIKKRAPAWLKQCMDLALWSLRRESELAIAKFTDVTDAGIEFHVAKKKKQGKGRDTRIMIEYAGLDELKAAVTACRDNIPSPYLIHRLPDNRMARHLQKSCKTKTHPTQVLPNYIGASFREARDASGIYDHLPRNQRPAFHDIRSLGATLYKEKGLHNDVVQALLGHEDAATTRVYLDRYELKVDVVRIA